MALTDKERIDFVFEALSAYRTHVHRTKNDEGIDLAQCAYESFSELVDKKKGIIR